MRANEQILSQELRQRGLAASSELTQACRISQPTVSRTIHSFGSAVFRTGAGPSTRYGLYRGVRSHGRQWPLYVVDSEGEPHHGGALTSMHERYFHISANEPLHPLLAGEFASGLFRDLPWFLQDLRPQGFLGRAFARTHHLELSAPQDPRLWMADDILSGLLVNGHDNSGNIIVGDKSLNLFMSERASGITPIPASQKLQHYDPLANRTIAGEPCGSTAAGEQPKFCACIEDDNGAMRRVIVKFSPPRNSPAGVRWADLLCSEQTALSILAQNGMPAAEARLLQGENRTYFESTRFDRLGAHGRRGMVSLAAVDAAYFGEEQTPWYNCAERLEQFGKLGENEAATLRAYYWYGQLIANSDMHYGNASLFWDNAGFRTAPCYDMLPMAYSPREGGEIVNPEFRPVPAPPQYREEWQRAGQWACDFWAAMADDARVSPEFRGISGANLRAVKDVLRN
ncbi:MAG: type II toxin-antitoxin system HipA family toxin YjjJ [Methylacidiphilales bacterium]|nr:type II toxin-antitoxin system HipA family toxin YjjJ [Candidatus Methylacidiphilales bacterium]